MSEVPRSSTEKTNKDMYAIIPLLPEHAEGIAELEQICFSMPWSEQSITELLSNPLAVYFVAVENSGKQNVIGYIGMYHIMTEGQINNIAVLPEYRRKGIATALFEKLLEYGQNESIETFVLEVRNSNEAALNFYAKLGFEEAGIRKNYYRSPAEDALLMTLKL